jgi:hypothetical protein
MKRLRNETTDKSYECRADRVERLMLARSMGTRWPIRPSSTSGPASATFASCEHCSSASSVSYGDFVELLFELLDERRRVPLEERLRGD